MGENKAGNELFGGYFAFKPRLAVSVILNIIIFVLLMLILGILKDLSLVFVC